MKYLINGANGFVGSNLSEYLRSTGQTVIRGDRDGSIGEEVDYIVDLASYGNIHGQDNVEAIYWANVGRVEKLLEEARNTLPDIKGIVLTSSSSVLLPKQTHYSRAKSRMEEVAVSESRRLPIVVMRPYTIYGLGDNPKHLIPTIFRSCLEGERIEFNPKGIHDYIYIEDYVWAINSLLRLADDLRGEIIELGTGVPTSNAEVLFLIERITGKKADIDSIAKPRGYDYHDWYCKEPISKSFISLYDGLRRTYDGQRTN